MYRPTEHFAKAHQEKLLREARLESKHANTSLLSRLIDSFFSTKEKASTHQPYTWKARNAIKSSQSASIRG